MQAFDDVMDDFLARGVDLVDGVANDEHGTRARPFGQRFEHGVLKVGHVGKIQRAVKAHRHHVR